MSVHPILSGFKSKGNTGGLCLYQHLRSCLMKMRRFTTTLSFHVINPSSHQLTLSKSHSTNPPTPRHLNLVALLGHTNQANCRGLAKVWPNDGVDSIWSRHIYVFAYVLIRSISASKCVYPFIIIMCMYVCIHIICMCVCMCVCTCVCMCVCVYIYILYLYIYIIYIYIYIMHTNMNCD